MIDLEQRLEWIRDTVEKTLARRGVVVQTSGGVDSSLTLRLCSEALGKERVYALFLPDRATDTESLACARAAARHAGVELHIEDITPVTAIRDETYANIVRRYEPDFDPEIHGTSINIDRRALVDLGISVYHLAIGQRNGEPVTRHRLRASDLRGLIAVQNRKQRYRMLCAYEVAERLSYAVVGASNRDELNSGFVVKYGDDAADICAIGDLSKTEVYELANALEIPVEIRSREPTTDTFTLRQSQDDYFYGGVEASLQLEPPAEAAPASLDGRGAHIRYLSVRSSRPPR